MLNRKQLAIVRRDVNHQAALDEVMEHDPDAGERADAQEDKLNDALGVRTGPVDAPWIVDEVNTPNGVAYFVNHVWEDEDSETGSAHTDEVCEVCMDYRGTRALDTARLIAAAPMMQAALRRFLDGHQAGMDEADARRQGSKPLKPRLCHCGPCDEARAALAAAGVKPT